MQLPIQFNFPLCVHEHAGFCFTLEITYCKLLFKERSTFLNVSLLCSCISCVVGLVLHATVHVYFMNGVTDVAISFIV